MAKGYSLHIGINVCDPEHYCGWSGPLEGCENDCDAMAAIAQAAQFETTIIKTKEATRQGVIDAIEGFAGKCESGDIFLLTYAGHGNTHPDHSGDEEDGKDETWVLYDDELFDDELRGLFTKFSAGVRIVFVSDSCHSGTVSKAGPPGGFGGPPGGGDFLDPVGANDKVRAMPGDVSEEVGIKWAKWLRGIRNSELAKIDDPIKASIVTLSGCRDDQKSKERDGHGLFTTALQEVWQDGQFDGTYREFREAIVRVLNRTQNATQEPQINTLGVRAEEMLDLPPFKLE